MAEAEKEQDRPQRTSRFQGARWDLTLCITHDVIHEAHRALSMHQLGSGAVIRVPRLAGSGFSAGKRCVVCGVVKRRNDHVLSPAVPPTCAHRAAICLLQHPEPRSDVTFRVRKEWAV